MRRIVMLGLSVMSMAIVAPATALADFQILTPDQAATSHDAPSKSVGKTFLLGDSPISSRQVQMRGLACFDAIDAPNRCYTNLSALSSAESVLTPKASAARVKHRHRRARAATHPGDPLTLWTGTSYTGASSSMSTSYYWIDMAPGFDLNVESGYAGNHTYYLSTLATWQSGTPTIGSAPAYTWTSSYYYWNNRWRSRCRLSC